MINPKAFFIISRYNEDVDWVKDYTDNYIIYNKGTILNDPKSLVVPNVGGNQLDIIHFAYEQYESLPDLMAFIQGFPFDHCKKETFDNIIFNEFFTQIEDYGFTPANGYENRTSDGKYMEINNSWYIQSHNASYNIVCKYSSFDEFMNKYFKDYIHLDYIQFSPGSQYIVEKQQFLYYPKSFWGRLSMELTKLNMTEAHIIERALFYILKNTYELR